MEEKPCFNFQFDLMEKRRIHETQGVMIRDNTHSGKTLRLVEVAAVDSCSSDIKRHFLPYRTTSNTATYGVDTWVGVLFGARCAPGDR